MKSILFFVFSMICVRSSAEPALLEGGVIGKGGGTAEQNVMYAYNNLEKYTGMCLRSNICGVDEGQRKKLAKIDSVISEERQHPDQIEFKSEKQNPGFFVIDGVVRAAKTGTSLGSKIYVNLDLIYTTLKSGGSRAMDIPAAAALLMHEFAHHVGYSNDLVAIDLIGAKLRTLLAENVQTVSINDDEIMGGISPRIEATAVSFEDSDSITHTELIISGTIGDHAINATGAIKEALRGVSPCRNYGGGSIEGIALMSLQKSRYFHTYSSSRRGYPVRARAKISCPQQNGHRFNNEYDVEVLLAEDPMFSGVIDPKLPPKVKLIHCGQVKRNCY